IEQERYLYPEMLSWLNAGCPPAPARNSLPGLSIDVTGIRALDTEEAIDLIGRIVPLLNAWERRDAERRAAEIVARSSNPLRTATFFKNVSAGRLNYADLGGYPYHVASFLSFAPEFSMRGH